MLNISHVTRSLDKKTQVLGLELTDIFALVVLCSVLNLLFGDTSLKLYLVYLPVFILSISLVVLKRGQPEGFLLHYLKFHLSPDWLTCFCDDVSEEDAFHFRFRKEQI